MSSINVTTRDGRHHVVEAHAGRSVMEIVREAGVDEMLAICGGGCSCSTCHVIVALEDSGRLTPMLADEDDLLETSVWREANSRLACQIPFNAALDGLHLSIAPDE
jgi:2Fe-2S ferredoxin